MASSVPSLPSVYPFRFAWTNFHVHCTTTGCRRSNCRILSIPWTKRWRFVHTRNLRGIFCKTEEPDPTSDKTSVRGKRCEKENLGQKPLDLKDFDFEKDLGMQRIQRFWNRIKNIEVQNLDSFEACSVHFYGAICFIQVATSVARARPEPPVIPKSKS